MTLRSLVVGALVVSIGVGMISNLQPVDGLVDLASRAVSKREDPFDPAFEA